MGYTDQENIDIAKQEYAKYEVGDEVNIGEDENIIGYVSEVIDNKKTGEQAFIITDVKNNKS